MKRVALLGGSFNPPHMGHFDMARYLYEHLKIDEVWMLFSQNCQKDSSVYASIEHRLEMAGILQQRYYGDVPIVLSDFQYRVNEHKTGDVLELLQRQYPDNHFIWVMGADSLVNFHTWERYEYIIENFPIVVLSRPPYTEQALSSHTALVYADVKRNVPDFSQGYRNGWILLNNPQADLSSSAFLSDLRAGQTKFATGFQEVADYILARGLYGLPRQPERGKLTY